MSKHIMGRFGRSQGGFTLVEMAIVLVIIGLIIAAISVGTDAQKNAENQKVVKKFLQEWVNAYNDFYARNGIVLGDNLANPIGVVNGTNGELSGTDLRSAVTNAGLTLPASNQSNAQDTYVYLDENGAPQTLTVTFNNDDTLENVMVITNVTASLARTLDMTVDGVADAGNGRVREFNGTTVEATAGTAWTSDTATNGLITAYWKMSQ